MNIYIKADLKHNHDYVRVFIHYDKYSCIYHILFLTVYNCKSYAPKEGTTMNCAE